MANRIAEVFGTRHVLLPVVHPIGRAEALASIRVCADAGVRGVFLIDQGMTAPEVLQLVLDVRERHPDLWLGVNLLSMRRADVLAATLEACGRIDGIWSDNAERGVAAFDEVRRTRGWTGLHFGGVAFKYQREVPHDQLGRVAAEARSRADVICTSGPGTGMAAEVSKVVAMRETIGDHALALASGVTPANVRSYMPHVDAFLVGTGIETRFGVFDPRKVEAMQNAIAQGVPA